VSPRPVRVAILGAGAGGLCMGARLRRAGHTEFTVYEQSDGVGGTWRDNRYPGAACDVPSMLYSFSFRPKRDWSRRFAEQPEILDYLEHVADAEGLRPHLRLRHRVVAATYDEGRAVWRLEVERLDEDRNVVEVREEEVDVVVSALGQLNRPHVPDLEGLDSFDGPAFHSARWDDAARIDGARVGVVGNSASAVQLVPRLAERAGHLTVFQRSANWVVPKRDRAYGPLARALWQRVPGLARLERWRTFWLLESTWFGIIRRGGPLGRLIRSRGTAELTRLARGDLSVEALVPEHDPGCNRLLLSNDWYPTLLRPDVSVECSHIARVVPDGVVTEDGRHHPLDVLVFATGFRTTEFLAPLRVRGRDGTELSETWREGAQAHLGVALPGFPNLFLLYGPNTNLGHNSILFMIEAQCRWVLQAVDDLARHDLASVEVRPSAMDRFARRTEHDLAATVWSEGCRSWYKTTDGRITNNWPSTATAYWWRTRRLDRSELRRLGRV